MCFLDLVLQSVLTNTFLRYQSLSVAGSVGGGLVPVSEEGGRQATFAGVSTTSTVTSGKKISVSVTRGPPW